VKARGVCADMYEGHRLFGLQATKCGGLPRDEILEAKLDRTPLDTFAPYLIPMKETDLEMVKRVACYSFYDAYEYGT
jgi:hypothetical protein